MVLSFIYLASASMADIHAGTSGFLAGAVLISGGVIALTLLSTHGHRHTPAAIPVSGEQTPLHRTDAA
jgi:hypothetical protein